MVEAKQPHVFLFGPLFELLYVERLYEKAAAALLLVRVLGPPHVDYDPDAAVIYPDQGPGTLLRVRFPGVVVDAVYIPGAYLKWHPTAPRIVRRGTCRPRHTGW